ncbi:hypothetical protein Poli38472_014079 [Pythium oligandrum]|uniref:PH domain-containing protein n=1 Tax=Pythium oligandrum TaxID=41045 RepID=A0A8K1FPC0_PYTOL|nr:hypothetical protein Poli38472_014079 [Pythium oligandrum]|eukprot:TMW66767.1 hypothetical protein Poli38472_014079 [Pythium oligandrum]
MNPLLSTGEAPASATNQVMQKISSGSESSAPVSEQVRVPEVAPSASPSAEPADSPGVSEDIAASANATNDYGSDKRAVASGSSESTVVVEEEPREESITRSHTANEEADVLTALPLSISMLSFSSLQSGADGTASVTDPKGDDACAAPDKTGWLKKKDGWNSWQTRYFELKSNRLYYFASESEGIPRGAIVLDHVHVLRGKGEHSMTFTITASNKSQHLEIIKFSSRMTHQIHPRKSCVLRVVQETEDNVSGWVTALNRASFYCNLSTNTSASGSGSVTSQSQSQSSSSPGRKKKTPFYRLRSPSSSASSVADDDNRQSSGTIDSASYHHFGSVKYLQETDPLLWEIHPHDQQKIRKKAAKARTRSDYVAIFTKYSSTFRQIFLPRPRPITIEQTLRDILPELFLINNVLYGGGDENNSLENIFEVLDGCIKKFASAQEERVRAVSSLLQACARTISGGDSYFVVHSLLGNPSMIIRPAEARGHPIEIEVSATNPHQICITVFSVFSFHHIEDVENYGDGEPGGSAAMPEPLLRIHTYHVQEFDFASGKSSRWLRIRADGVKEDNEGQRTSWVSKRNGSETGFGALLDALS